MHAAVRSIISLNELVNTCIYCSVIAGVRVEPSAFEEMFKEADATEQGKIGFPEFLSMMGRRMKQV